MDDLSRPNGHLKETFQDKAVTLDDGVFRDCAFVRCQLIFSGGNLPVLSGCRFEGCRWSFTEEAGNTLAFLAALKSGGFASLVEETLAALLDGSLLQSPEQESPSPAASTRTEGQTDGQPDGPMNKNYPRPPLPPRIDLGFGTFPVPRIVKVKKPKT